MKVLRILGRSGSGKTTFISNLISHLSDLRVGVVKHTRHPFTPPPPDKDTGKHFGSGALFSLGISPESGELFWKGPAPRLEDLRALCSPHCDVLLVEGARDWDLPTILLGEAPPEAILMDIVCRLAPRPAISEDVIGLVRRFLVGCA